MQIETQYQDRKNENLKEQVLLGMCIHIPKACSYE